MRSMVVATERNLIGPTCRTARAPTDFIGRPPRFGHQWPLADKTHHDERRRARSGRPAPVPGDPATRSGARPGSPSSGPGSSSSTAPARGRAARAASAAGLPRSAAPARSPGRCWAGHRGYWGPLEVGRRVHPLPGMVAEQSAVEQELDQQGKQPREQQRGEPTEPPREPQAAREPQGRVTEQAPPRSPPVRLLAPQRSCSGPRARRARARNRRAP